MSEDARKRILVAEDDQAIRDLVVRALGARYQVTAVGDGAEAVKVAMRVPAPDLVILDVMMPSLDGFGVAERLRGTASLRRIPIIFITAKDSPLDKIKGIQAGARHYITKPFKLDDLLVKVKKALGG